MNTKQLIAVYAILLLGLSGESSYSQRTEESTEQYVDFSENVFSFEIPKTWTRMKESDLKQFRQQFEEQSKHLANQYPHTRSKDFKAVPYLTGFFAYQQQILLVAVVIQIPPQATDYLDQMHEESKEKILWGIEKGKIRRALSNRKTRINEMPVLEIDMEMADGSRMITYNFHFPNHPDQGVGIVFLCEPMQYAAHQSVLNHIISTLRISFLNKK